MKSGVASICLGAFLMLSQLLAVVVAGNGVAWCQHADGDVFVETAAQQADCHSDQTDASHDDELKSCVDLPLGDWKPSHSPRADSSRELAALHATAWIAVLPAFTIELHEIQSKSATVTVAVDHPLPRGVILTSLSTVILLT